MLHAYIVRVDNSDLYLRASEDAITNGFMMAFREFKNRRKDIEFSWEKAGAEPHSWKTSRKHLQIVNHWLHFWRFEENPERTMSTQTSGEFCGPFFPCIDCVAPTLQVCTRCGKAWQVSNSVSEHPLEETTEGIVVRHARNWRRRLRSE